MYMYAPVSGDQYTVLTPHDVDTETLVGGQGPGDIRRKKRRKKSDYYASTIPWTEHYGRIFELL